MTEKEGKATKETKREKKNVRTTEKDGKAAKETKKEEAKEVIEEKTQRNSLKEQKGNVLEKEYNCEECKISMVSEREFGAHVRDKHMKPGRKKECIICGWRAETIRDMVRHMKTEHMKYRCDMCGQMEDSGQKLELHKVMRHQGANM